MMIEPIFLFVDLFCGAGGTTTGIVQAEIEGHGIAKVVACVNHDHKAIESHWKNHPEVKHFEEDIRTLDLTELIKIVNKEKNKYPDAYVILWASLECTNFSKAKGGQPRDADSRTLAEHLYRYVHALNPDYVQIENVVEFMSWGPLDENGKPVSRKNGQDWMNWRNEICSFGYRDEWKEMNSANYGAYTSRNRLFGCFAKDNLPIVWPAATHAKKPSKNSIYGDLKKWKAVKEVLNFEDEGESIFTRKKPLSDKTLERIYAGLIKYVANGDTSFISKYYSGKPSDKNKSVEVPADSITTIDHHSLVQADFLLKYNSTDKNGKHTPPSIEDPCPVISTQGRLGLVHSEFLMQSSGGKSSSKVSSVENPARVITTSPNQSLVQPEFLASYYGNGHNISSIESPSPTLTTKDRVAIVQPKYFIDQQYGKYAQNQSINEPAGTILPTDKHRLIEVQHYLVNHAWGGNPGSVEEPCCVIVARQDKVPLSFVQVEKGNIAIAVFDCDSAIMIKIKEFMSLYGLVDIKMRMLRVLELLKIQGFPAKYKLEGNQSDQKKFIGNSVVPQVVKCWVEALGQKLIDGLKIKAA